MLHHIPNIRIISIFLELLNKQKYAIYYNIQVTKKALKFIHKL